jgi:hypothetical protein
LVGYAPTYFPGTPIAAEATPLTVQAGDVREFLSFTITRVPMASIHGTVIAPTGEPVQAARIAVEAEGPPLPRNATVRPRIIAPNARGEFSIASLAPGRYRIRAVARGTINREGRALAQTEWALADVAVSGADVTGVTLLLQDGRLFSGRVSAPSTVPIAGAMVVLQATTGSASLALNGIATGAAVRQALVGPDGRFTVTGLVPDVYEVRVTSPSASPAVAGGWTIESIRQSGRDLRDAPLTFAEGSIEDAEIVLTTSMTELAGRLTSASGVPAADFFLVAFPDDRTLWHPTSPRIRVVRPAADGAFSIRDLPAGAYRLAALVEVEDSDARRREFLDSIYDGAVRVAVEAGKTIVQELRIR